MCSHPQNRLSNSPSFFIMDDKQFDQFVDQMMDQEQIDDDMDLGAYQDYHDYMLKMALEGPNFDYGPCRNGNPLSDY
jgi:hypothetical protein